MSKNAGYCPPGQAQDANDMPIGKMMGNMMRKKVDSKVPPKKKDSGPPPGDDSRQNYFRG